MAWLTQPHDQEWQIIVRMVPLKTFRKPTHLATGWGFPMMSLRLELRRSTLWIFLSPFPRYNCGVYSTMWKLTPLAIVSANFFQLP